MERELDAIDEEEEDYEAEFDYKEEARALAQKQKEAEAEGSAASGDDAARDTEKDRDEQNAGDASETPVEESPAFAPDAVDAKLEQVMDLRNEERYDEARTLLYEVLVEGSDQQVKVARNILSQLDS